MAEIAQLRLFLEVPAAGLAARALGGDQLGRLRELVTEIERTAARGDLAGNLDADREFHLAVTGICGNRRLVGQVARLRDQTRLYNLRHLAASGELTASAAEHRPLLAAIEDGDQASAENLMRAHLAHLTGDWSAD
jgi:DNA-binding GntR family transcriptional regulator